MGEKILTQYLKNKYVCVRLSHDIIHYKRFFNHLPLDMMTLQRYIYTDGCTTTVIYVGTINIQNLWHISCYEMLLCEKSQAIWLHFSFIINNSTVLLAHLAISVEPVCKNADTNKNMNETKNTHTQSRRNKEEWKTNNGRKYPHTHYIILRVITFAPHSLYPTMRQV